MLPFSFLPTPARLAVGALNALLKREDWARERLARHAGKTVRFALGGFTLGLTIDSEGLAAQADAAVVPDVTLTVAPEKLPLPRLGAGGAAPDFAEATHISGDAALAQALQGSAEQLLVADGSQGRRQVRVELKDEVLPGVSVSVYEAEGRVVADFTCASETSRERLASLARPLAGQLAESLGRPTRVRVATDDPEDPCLTETDADAPLR